MGATEALRVELLAYRANSSLSRLLLPELLVQFGLTSRLFPVNACRWKPLLSRTCKLITSNRVAGVLETYCTHR